MQNLQNVICITDRHLCHRPFQDQMRIVAAMKPKAVILREKDVMEDTYRILVERILPVCEEQGVPMIVHTFYNVALEMGIKRVQIPLSQLRDVPEETRKQFEVLGTTVHSVEDAKEAVSSGRPTSPRVLPPAEPMSTARRTNSSISLRRSAAPSMSRSTRWAARPASSSTTALPEALPASA